MRSVFLIGVALCAGCSHIPAEVRAEFEPGPAGESHYRSCGPDYLGVEDEDPSRC